MPRIGIPTRDQSCAACGATFKAFSRQAWVCRECQVGAQRKVAHAVSAGRLLRQPCEVCAAPKAQAHHEDYAKPLDVRWLCRPHHVARHMEMRGAA